MHRTAAAAAALLFLLLVPALAQADRRYFVQSYTPYLAPKDNLELEVFSTVGLGQGDSTRAAWKNRIEFEYGVSDRLTGAFYLNFKQDGDGAATVFDGPSFELIYRLADPGRLPVDPAAYLEVRANGSELELEPKLLLARRIYRLVSVLNLVGEYERIHSGPEAGETEKAMQVTAGASREIGHTVAIGVEAVYSRSFADSGPDPSSVQIGPTLNFQTARIQIAIGWHPQVSGHPKSAGRLNLADFPRSEVRLILGVEL